MFWKHLLAVQRKDVKTYAKVAIRATKRRKWREVMLNSEPHCLGWAAWWSHQDLMCDPSFSSNQTSWRKANLTCKIAIDNLEKAELLQGGDSLRQRYLLLSPWL